MRLTVRTIPLEPPAFPGLQRVNVFLIESEKPVLIDSGYEESVNDLSLKLEEIGFGLDEIFMVVNTHEHIDHFGGNATIKERAGVRIAAHEIAVPLIEDMRKQLPPEEVLNEMPEIIVDYARIRASIYEKLKTVRVDVRLKEGDSIEAGGLSLEVLHTPGHAPGHICLYERENRFLFAGDMITGRGTPFVGCLQASLEDFLKSLQRLKRLKIDRAFLSHDGEIKEVHKRIDEILQQKFKMEQKLLEILGEGEKELSELVDSVYPGGFPYFTYNSVLAHLLKLREEKRVRMVKREGKFFIGLVGSPDKS
ncbi:MAG: MBL fold metallo-hydrolase [Candidatus Hadarchaeales archaeon]